MYFQLKTHFSAEVHVVQTKRAEVDDKEQKGLSSTMFTKREHMKTFP